MPECTIIIPVFDQRALTAQCLETLLAQNCGTMVVVDDGSTDGTPDMLAAYGGRIRVIRHSLNLGFAKSCNDGALGAETEWLVFLNNDTIPHPGWLEALMKYAREHERAAVVGSKLLYPDDTVQHAGVVICQDRYPRHLYTGFPAEHPAVNRSRRFQIVTAACMLVRRAVFHEVGGFDLAYRNGFEDVDFCLRLGEAGHEIHYCHESVLLHLESVSPGRFESDRENVALYRKRWIDRVRPDDLNYYVEDDLLRVSYEGRFPLAMRVSPLLGTLDDTARMAELEGILRTRSRQILDLQRENTRLRLELGTLGKDSVELEYHRLRERIRDIARTVLPAGTTVLVISRGDGSLLELDGCRGWHFPQSELGAYAGHHPESCEEAISHLRTLCAKGAEYLLIPATSRWWLDHYTGLRDFLDAHTRLVAGTGDSCQIFALSSVTEHETEITHANGRIIA